MKNKSWIIVMKDDGKSVLKRYPAVFDTDKNTVRVVTSKEPKVVKVFKATKMKQAVHMAREIAVLTFKNFDPQIHFVTVAAREPAPEAEAPPPVKKKIRK